MFTFSEKIFSSIQLFSLALLIIASVDVTKLCLKRIRSEKKSIESFSKYINEQVSKIEDDKDFEEYVVNSSKFFLKNFEVEIKYQKGRIQSQWLMVLCAGMYTAFLFLFMTKS